jgi:hypothetical protein
MRFEQALFGLPIERHAFLEHGPRLLVPMQPDERDAHAVEHQPFMRAVLELPATALGESQNSHRCGRDRPGSKHPDGSPGHLI